jgi:uncharacterized SAM-binding protein YcdF (DUF218 family)
MACVLVLALLTDFGLFLHQIIRTVPDPQAMADGIAVLTGARERIGLAARLLAEGKGKRLLISGVNERTNLGDVLRIDPALERLAGCCVDIGRKATNTIGNAQEINHWARQHQYQRIILVTSDYHMPRAALEAGHANPTLTFLLWPVPSSGDGRLPRLTDLGAWRLVVTEWMKLHVVLMRIAFGLPMADND